MVKAQKHHHNQATPTIVTKHPRYDKKKYPLQGQRPLDLHQDKLTNTLKLASIRSPKHLRVGHSDTIVTQTPKKKATIHHDCHQLITKTPKGFLG